ncbi:MAG: Gfo/Idh/MocA family oxidoreductase [Sedimentisphaerales bacterium]|nr:Gfo/Idh/MocA family oxidoreductase [Sedimentisphaerales bacterium]
MRELKIGIIGCGAVAKYLYLPAVSACSFAKVEALVDKNISRAEALAKKFSAGYVAGDYSEVFNRVEAVIIALPHFLHAPVSIDFLKRGIHVLVEKPMAMTVEQCDDMIEAADLTGSVLAVGLVRRFYNTSRFVKQIIDEGWLGRIQSFDFREGSIYNWPVASDFFFKKDSGGGLLADTGAHTLDMLLWWLGDYEALEYYDDSFGGVEANCELHLSLKSGARGIVELSRVRNLRNTYRLNGDKASLELGLDFNSTICLKPNNGYGLEGKINSSESTSGSFLDIVCQQLQDFATAVRENRKPFVKATDAKKSVALIEDCYWKRLRLNQPWLTAACD